MFNRITYSNLKGRSGSHELTKFNIVHGNNSTGKTAILDAVTLALLGYHPKLGKKPNLTFQLATPTAKSMTVAAGSQVMSWSKNPKGAVTVEGLEGLGEVPPVMLDLEEWLALSGPARVQYILEHCGTVEGGDWEALDGLLQLNPKVGDQVKSLDRKDTATYLRKLGDIAKVNRQQAAVAFDTIQGAIQQTLLNPEAAAPKSVEREIKQIDSQLKIANDQLAKIAGQKMEIDRRATDRKKAIDRIGDPAAKIVALKEKLAVAEAASKDLQVEIPAAEENLQKVSKAKYEIDSKLNACREQAARLQRQIAMLRGHGECPTCQSKIDSAQLIEKLSSDLDAEEMGVNELAENATEVTAEMNGLSVKVSKLRTDLQKAAAEIVRFNSAISSEESQLEVLNTLKKESEEQPVVADATAFQEEVAKLTSQKEPLLVQQKDYLAWKGTERQRAEAIIQRDGLNLNLENAKALQLAIKAMEVKLLDQVIGGLCSEANGIIQPVLGESLGYADGEFTVGGIPLSTLSGSEELVAFAGLQLALASSVPNKILLLDELGRLDQKRFQLLMQAIDVLLEKGTISQFIGVLPHEDPKIDDIKSDLTLIKVGGDQ